MKKNIQDSTNVNELVKNCDSCDYNPVPRISIDDAPPVCWECVRAMKVYKFPYPFWKPIKNGNSTD
jgi:hypothetical protein